MKASNTGASDSFGWSLALSADGNTLAVGSSFEDSANTGIIPGAPVEMVTPDSPLGTNSGAIYVFTRSDITWTPQAYVKASNTGANDWFGSSVALSADGNTLAAGADGEASSSTGIGSTPNEATRSAGAVYVYTRSGIIWTPQAYVKASNPGADDYFGRSVALSADGNTLAVGASGEDSAKTGIIPGAPVEIDTPDSGTNSGAIYLFTRSSAAWSQQAYVKASNTGGGDSFGGSVALSDDGNTLAAGAFVEASAATGVNNTVLGQSDNSTVNAGAVYLY